MIIPISNYMKRNGVLVILTIMLILSLVASASAWSYSSHQTIRTQKTWNPWINSMPSSPYGMQSYGMGGQMMYSPMRYGGMFMGQCWDPYMCGYAFYANETQIAEVSGRWDSDILGTMNIMLTGDDTIRGLYEVNGTTGYLEGNFTSNETQGMDGLWWEEPSYQPPMSAGIITMTFVDDSHLKGVFSYPDGMWGEFTASKAEGNLTPEIEEKLKDMPEVNWTVNADEVKDYRVSNKPEDNPVLTPASE